ncbi:hypothetical protein [Methylobacterium segetis]|uniref:hypothetical protein n=1 Tax=Methylobacterium segetis TaxID=2488750 RepID=UPI00104EB676|nr:hypothetical protein [Methylobacterium segetis]
MMQAWEVLMFVLMAMAIAGGLMTGAALAPQGFLIAILGAPLGGSLCAALAAFVLMRRRGADWREDADLDARTDAMVASLRALAERGRSTDEVPSASAGTRAA